MPKIILPTDFSDNASRAAVFAAATAARCGAAIYLVHAMENAADPLIEPIALDTVLLEKHTREEFERLRSLKQHLSQEYPSLRIEFRLLRGQAAGAIQSLAQKETADLIIMGAHGSGRLKETIIGSTTAETIAHSKIPVIAVPPEYSFQEPDALLLATHKFAEDKAAMNGLILMANAFGARVDVVSVVNEREGMTAEYFNIRWNLNHYLEFLHRTFPAIEFFGEELVGDDLQESIDQYCRKHSIGMVTLFNHPRSIMDKLCRRNPVRKAVFHSNVPVLVLPGS
jgi:nucleotide-binding universal stress UspA family protein